jgi:hypothetical protein
VVIQKAAIAQRLIEKDCLFGSWVTFKALCIFIVFMVSSFLWMSKIVVSHFVVAVYIPYFPFFPFFSFS